MIYLVRTLIQHFCEKPRQAGMTPDHTKHLTQIISELFKSLLYFFLRGELLLYFDPEIIDLNIEITET